MAYRIGIDLGGTGIKIGIVDAAGRIVHKHSIKTRANRPYQDIIGDMAEGVVRALDDAGIGMADCISAGIGSPGVCDGRHGIVVFAGNLGFVNAPIVEELRRYLSLPVYLSNDANCAALGESLYGSAKGTRDSVLVTLGTGIGGGIIIDGKIYTGALGAGAEIGHMVLVPDGEACTCGERGCFEAYASATALVRMARRAAQAYPESALTHAADGKAVFDAAAAGDTTAKAVLDDYLKYLSIGIVGLVNMLRPDVVLIGGGISNAGDALIVSVGDYVARHSFAAKYVQAPPVRRAMLGNDAGVIGAAMLGNDNCM